MEVIKVRNLCGERWGETEKRGGWQGGEKPIEMGNDQNAKVA